MERKETKDKWKSITEKPDTFDESGIQRSSLLKLKLSDGNKCIGLLHIVDGNEVWGVKKGSDFIIKDATHWKEAF